MALAGVAINDTAFAPYLTIFSTIATNAPNPAFVTLTSAIHPAGFVILLNALPPSAMAIPVRVSPMVYGVLCIKLELAADPVDRYVPALIGMINGV